MAVFKPLMGNRTSLNSVEKHAGHMYFCTDDGSLHLDFLDDNGNLQRKQISAQDAETLMGMSLEEIKKSIKWNDIADRPTIPSIDGLATKVYVDEALDGKADSNHNHNSAYDAKGAASSALNSAKAYTDTAKAELTETITAKADNSTVTDHTGNKSNPHGVTLSQLGVTASADELNKLDGVTATTAELNYVDGVTSNIQTQLNAKASATDLKAHTDSKSNPHGVTAAQVGADTKGSAAAVQANLDAVDDKVDEHIGDETIHVTTTNKTNWNAAHSHSQATHARTDATKVADSTTNGNILINGTETNVYTHPNSGVTAGTYKSVTVNAQGHITGGTNPTTLAGYGITDAESKGAANTALASAKQYTDTVAGGKADADHNHDADYDAKGAANSALASAKAYADSAATTAATKVKNDLLNGAGGAYDTLKELGDLIDDNTDAIDALETVAAGKADSVHTHVISDVTNLQTTLDGKAAKSHGTHVSYSTTAPVMDGTAAAGSASTVARSDHKHPTDTSRAAKTDFDSHTGNTTAHITSTERSNWNAAKTHADSAHAPSNAQPNQNAFSNIKVGSTTVAADTTTDTVEFVGSNVTITPDATNDKVTFTVADGSTSAKGVVQLTNSTSSTSTTTAATPAAVKSAYDLANTAKTNAATAQTKANSAYDLAASKADSLSDLGITATAAELNYVDGVTSNVQTQLDSKVDKVSGKGLSTNDYTTTEKNKLAGIAEGANKYTLPAAGSSLGGVKSGGDVTISDGVITVKDDSHAHVIGNVDGLQTALDEKINVKHWSCPVTIGSYSRICEIYGQSSGILSLGFSQASQASYHSYIVGTSWAKAEIYQIGSNGYATNADQTIRVVQGSSETKYYIEVLNNFGYNGATTMSVSCAYVPFSKSVVCTPFITYTATDSNATVRATVTSKYNGIVAPKFYGDLTGNADTASSTAKLTGLTASRALVSDSSGNATASAVTSTELGYLDGVTSGIQAQLDSKSGTGHTHAAGDITSGTLSSSRLPTVPETKGGTGQTSLINSANALMNALGAGDSDPVDTSCVITQGVGDYSNKFYRKPISYIWNYIKGKTDPLYATKATATTSANGLMSSADKSKLDGIASGANKTTVDSSLSTSSTNPVQNKVVKAALDSKSDSGHTHNYAGSSSAGGSATSAVKLDSSAGSATQPVYFSGGKPVATTYTLGKSVPSDAKFTDTTYSAATTSKDGLMSSTDKKKVDAVSSYYQLGDMSGKTKADLQTALDTWLNNYCNIPNATASFSASEDWATVWNSSDTTKTISAGGQWQVTIIARYSSKAYTQLRISYYSDERVYYVVRNNSTWLTAHQAAFKDDLPSAAGSSLGLVKSGGDVTISSGVITVNDDSHAHVISNVDGLQAALDGKEVKGAASTALGEAKTYTDTEIGEAKEEIEASMAEISETVGTKASNSDLTSHKNNKSNPHGVTLSQLGVTATAAELNILDGVTATAAELNYVDGVTSNIQTQLNAKAASSTVTSHTGNKSNPHGVTAAQVGADPKGTASSAVSSHNTSTSAHSDIRDLITGLTTRLNTLANSDDTTLDQLSEIVAYIKSNKSLIDSITTSKVNVTDIINNLTTNTTNKPLSAAQGVALKALIDALNTELDSHTHSYAGSSSAGGSATSAVKLDSSAGSATQPVYFSGGKPVATTYTLGKSVPSNAKFTDTTYSNATTSAAGLMSATDKAKVHYTNVAYGTCATAAATAAKVIEISGNSNWVLEPGSLIVVKFTYTNSASNPTFNVNNTGAKSVLYNTSVLTTSSLNRAGYANRYCEYMYDGTQFVFVGWSLDSDSTYSQASLGQGYGTCSTAEATTAKVVTLSSYSLRTNGIVSVKFTYAVPASATMNINSKGAKAIFSRGAAITAGKIKAGDIATFIYDGTQYHLLCVDRDENTTYSAAGSSLGLVKSGGDVTIASGTITVNDDSHNHVISNVDNLQASLDAKQATITGAATTITGSNLTASRALVSDSSGKVAVSAVTSTELGYLDGVTSGVQTQLNSKLPKDSGTATSLGVASANTEATGFKVGRNSSFSSEYVSHFVDDSMYTMKYSNDETSNTIKMHMIATDTESGTGTNKSESTVTFANANNKSTVTAGTFNGALSGNADTATKLKTARTIRTNLASTSTASFDGSGNVTPGVTGTLPIANGGTGATTAAGALTNLGLTATAAELNKMDGVTATTTELNYVDGVTSAIQPQLDSKLPKSGGTLTGKLTASSDGISTTKIDSGTSTFTLSGGSTVYLNRGNTTSLIFQKNGVENARFDTNGHFLPGTDSTYDIGASSKAWKNVYADTFTGALSGNASSATKLATARTIALGTGATGTATSFDGSGNITIPVTAVKEAYLSWGGQSINGGVSPVGAALSAEHSANRLAYLNPAALSFEYSDNGGSSWTSWTVSDANKIGLVTTSASIAIGNASTVTTNHRTRMTLTAQNGTKGYVYTRPRKLLINVNNAGHGISLTIEYKSGASGASWNTLGTYALSGWSGWNDIDLSALPNLGGGTNQTSNYWYYRFTFATTSVNSSHTTTKSQILGIRLFGDTCWTRTSNMGETGHLYSYDTAQNATFPANVTATTFVGALSGNASTATKATQDASGNVITSTYATKTELSGKADSSHGTHVTWSTTTPKANGTAAVGSETKVARGDHVHPLQTTVSGNAGTATKFASAQSVALTGDVTGSASSQAGWSVATTLANSGVTAGSYGPSANASPAHGKTFSVPYITVDAKGRVTSASTKTITLPADNNTTYSAATTSAAGLMSAADKTKLDGIASGATANTGTITAVQANGTNVATSGVANIPAASTSAYGVTKLSSATNSTSTSLAATASAVKAAYDLANGKASTTYVDNAIATAIGNAMSASY